MNVKDLAGDAASAFVSQGTSLIVGAATSLLVPKVLGVGGFGYWQLFLFYGSYVGFCHLGLNDGVYLLNGGVHRNEANLRSLNSQMWVGICFELIVGAVVAAFAVFGPVHADRSFVLFAVSLYLVVYNTSYYLGFVFQALGETRLFSRSILIGRVSFLLPLAGLLILRVDDFRLFVLGQLFSQVVALAWCAWKARDILSSGLLPPALALHDALGSVAVGIKLMLSNIASMFVLGVLRFAVDAKWGIHVFGQLSLSLSLISFVLTFVSQIGMVLFPALRRATGSEAKLLFSAVRDALTFVMPAFYVLIVPAVSLLSVWLPLYSSGLRVLLWLLPICVFDARMSILGTTFLKVLRAESSLLVINLLTVGISVVGVIVGVFVLDSLEVALGSAVFAIVFRSLFAERYVSVRISARQDRSIVVAEVLLTLAYLGAIWLLRDFQAFVLCTASYATFLLVFRRRISALCSRAKSVF